MMLQTVVDIGEGEIDIFVGNQLVLHFGQTSDKETINLFLYPEGVLEESMIHKEDSDDTCTHEILITRDQE